ncbi:unnamed protein product [Vicia faba]|uniref:Uncharacterized protein n=1 Tax=Vicia faba TaxID=3906 RepID=A0AAV0YPM1_VICFA|nr:unnamed protein product [Vicia faba]
MSHHRANVSSQLSNWTLSQPSQQGAGSSHLQTNVSPQLPNQTSSQPAQQGPGSSQCNDNVSSPLPSQTSFQPVQQEVERRQRRSERTSTHYWFVDALGEEHGTIQKLCLSCKDVNDKPNALRIIMEFDKYHSPIGEVASLLAGWKTLFQNSRFCFKVHKDLAKRYIEVSIGKNWKKYRLKLWNAKYDPLLSKSQITENKPEDINMDNWALYVHYHFKPETMDYCKKNQQIRNKQVFSHTCGAKSLARRRHKLIIETGKTISRGQM